MTFEQLTASNPSKNKIKESFMDKDRNEIKQLIQIYQDGTRKENFLVLENCYNLGCSTTYFKRENGRSYAIAALEL